ncbi:hypothetical protein SAMN05892877_1098 [Rhizobium subbaraonis]|uniref:Uncharacterized protein n=1 Tax=Rhizobium subbaraonis TaxID=908946 RepID=A0A285UJI9_9HYPH|nr:hypothetical protein [Rhizobium subbaraonis]SOC41568.1 hypothetical protein SAMN05892877_1098 [Rhizobium subbaraonis]
MTKKPKTISPAADDTVTDGAAAGNQPSVVLVIATEGDPSGENGPDGTNTPASESGDAADKASAEPVKPQDATTLTPADPAEATKVATDPEVEAAASGTNSTDTPESDRMGEAGNLAGLATEVREFELASAVRHDNRYFAEGQTIALTEDEHGSLWDAGIVDAWETGTPV